MVSDAIRQGRLQEFRGRETARSVATAPETMRVPLNDEYRLNKKLARQIFEQELLEKVKSNLSKQE